MISNIAIFWFLVLRETLQFEKYECADFKYDDSFSKLQPINTQIKHFCPKFEIFLFCTKLCILTNSKVLISNITIAFFKSQLSNTYQRHWPPIWRVFCFSRTFAFWQIWGYWFQEIRNQCKKHCTLKNLRILISNMVIFFFKFPPKKAQIKHFQCKLWSFFLWQ